MMVFKIIAAAALFFSVIGLVDVILLQKKLREQGRQINELESIEKQYRQMLESCAIAKVYSKDETRKCLEVLNSSCHIMNGITVKITEGENVVLDGSGILPFARLWPGDDFTLPISIDSECLKFEVEMAWIDETGTLFTKRQWVTA